MLQKIIYFLKYNNVALIILSVILILGGAAFAAGPEAVGQKQTSVRGLDNTALLAADFNNFNMDFKIEKIEQDEKYYYATYSFLDLAVIDNAWQYQLNSRTRKISKKIKEDLGQYLVKFLAKHYEARLRELKRAQSEAASLGLEKRVEVTEYSGLMGRTLNLAAKVFPGYEPVKKRELPAPEFNLPENPPPPLIEGGRGADNLTRIYNDYVAAHPEIFMDIASSTPLASSTPVDLTGSASADTIMASSSADAVNMPPADTAMPEIPVAAETPAITEPESVEVIELPTATESEPAAEAEAAAEVTPSSVIPAQAGIQAGAE